MVVKSIEEFGFKVLIVIIKDYIIIVGYMRFKVSFKFGFDEVFCIIVDDLMEE